MAQSQDELQKELNNAYEALKKADAAGDTDAASALARYAHDLERQMGVVGPPANQPQPQAPAAQGALNDEPSRTVGALKQTHKAFGLGLGHITGRNYAAKREEKRTMRSLALDGVWSALPEPDKAALAARIDKPREEWVWDDLSKAAKKEFGVNEWRDMQQQMRGYTPDRSRALKFMGGGDPLDIELKRRAEADIQLDPETGRPANEAFPGAYETLDEQFTDDDSFYEKFVRPQFTDKGPEIIDEELIEWVDLYKQEHYTPENIEESARRFTVEGVPFWQVWNLFDETTADPYNNFAAFWLKLIENTPQILASIVGGKGTGAAASSLAVRNAARKAGGINKLAASRISELQKRAGITSGVVAGTSIEGYLIHDQVFNETMSRARDLPQDVWDNNSKYRGLVDEGLSPESAKDILSVQAAGKAADTAMIVSVAVLGSPGAYYWSRMAGVSTTPQGVLRGAGQGFFFEGIQEGSQEASEAFSQNIGLRLIDPEIALTTGMTEHFWGGTMIGGPTGGAVGSVEGALGRGAGLPKDYDAFVGSIEKMNAAIKDYNQFILDAEKANWYEDASTQEQQKFVDELFRRKKKVAELRLEAENKYNASDKLAKIQSKDDVTAWKAEVAASEETLAAIAKRQKERLESERELRLDKERAANIKRREAAVRMQFETLHQTSDVLESMDKVLRGELLTDEEFDTLERLGYGKYTKDQSDFILTPRGVEAREEMQREVHDIRGQIKSGYVGEDRRADYETRSKFDVATPSEFREIALTDPVTKLPNRRAMQERIEEKGEYDAIAFVDVDTLKWVNENMSNSAGDQLLRIVADEITELGRNVDTYRLGGDEFIVAGPTQQILEDALQAAARRLEGGRAVTEGGQSVRPTITWGTGKDIDEANEMERAQKVRRRRERKIADRGEKPFNLEKVTVGPSRQAEPRKKREQPLAALPDSALIAAAEDADPVSMPLTRFTPEERQVLRDAGLVMQETSPTGETFEAVRKDALFAERDRRFQEGTADQRGGRGAAAAFVDPNLDVILDALIEQDENYKAGGWALSPKSPLALYDSRRVRRGQSGGRRSRKMIAIDIVKDSAKNAPNGIEIPNSIIADPDLLAEKLGVSNNISDRGRKVMRLRAEGLSNSAIAKEIGVSKKRIDSLAPMIGSRRTAEMVRDMLITAAYRHQGKTFVEIGKIVGTSTQVVAKRLRRAPEFGIDPGPLGNLKGAGRKSEIVRQILKLHKEGFTSRQIEKETGLEYKTVRNAVRQINRRYGIKRGSAVGAATAGYGDDETFDSYWIDDQGNFHIYNEETDEYEMLSGESSRKREPTKDESKHILPKMQAEREARTLGLQFMTEADPQITEWAFRILDDYIPPGPAHRTVSLVWDHTHLEQAHPKAWEELKKMPFGLSGVRGLFLIDLPENGVIVFLKNVEAEAKKGLKRGNRIKSWSSVRYSNIAEQDQAEVILPDGTIKKGTIARVHTEEGRRVEFGSDEYSELFPEQDYGWQRESFSRPTRTATEVNQQAEKVRSLRRKVLNLRNERNRMSQVKFFDQRHPLNKRYWKASDTLRREEDTLDQMRDDFSYRQTNFKWIPADLSKDEILIEVDDARILFSPQENAVVSIRGAIEGVSRDTLMDASIGLIGNPSSPKVNLGNVEAAKDEPLSEERFARHFGSALMHEVVAHFGIRGATRDYGRYEKLMHSIVDAFPKYVIQLREKGYTESDELTGPQNKALFGEEVLAWHLEKHGEFLPKGLNVKQQSVIRRFLTWFKKQLAYLGLDRAYNRMRGIPKLNARINAIYEKIQKERTRFTKGSSERLNALYEELEPLVEKQQNKAFWKDEDLMAMLRGLHQYVQKRQAFRWKAADNFSHMILPMRDTEYFIKPGIDILSGGTRGLQQDEVITESDLDIPEIPTVKEAYKMATGNRMPFGWKLIQIRDFQEEAKRLREEGIQTNPKLLFEQNVPEDQQGIMRQVTGIIEKATKESEKKKQLLKTKKRAIKQLEERYGREAVESGRVPLFPDYGTLRDFFKAAEAAVKLPITEGGMSAMELDASGLLNHLYPSAVNKLVELLMASGLSTTDMTKTATGESFFGVRRDVAKTLGITEKRLMALQRPGITLSKEEATAIIKNAKERILSPAEDDADPTVHWAYSIGPEIAELIEYLVANPKSLETNQGLRIRDVWHMHSEFAPSGGHSEFSLELLFGEGSPEVSRYKEILAGINSVDPDVRRESTKQLKEFSLTPVDLDKAQVTKDWLLEKIAVPQFEFQYRHPFNRTLRWQKRALELGVPEDQMPYYMEDLPEDIQEQIRKLELEDSVKGIWLGELEDDAGNKRYIQSSDIATITDRETTGGRFTGGSSWVGKGVIPNTYDVGTIFQKPYNQLDGRVKHPHFEGQTAFPEDVGYDLRRGTTNHRSIKGQAIHTRTYHVKDADPDSAPVWNEEFKGHGFVVVEIQADQTQYKQHSYDSLESRDAALLAHRTDAAGLRQFFSSYLSLLIETDINALLSEIRVDNDVMRNTFDWWDDEAVSDEQRRLAEALVHIAAAQATELTSNRPFPSLGIRQIGHGHANLGSVTGRTMSKMDLYRGVKFVDDVYNNRRQVNDAEMMEALDKYALQKIGHFVQTSIDPYVLTDMGKFVEPFLRLEQKQDATTDYWQNLLESVKAESGADLVAGLQKLLTKRMTTKPDTAELDTNTGVGFRTALQRLADTSENNMPGFRLPAMEDLAIDFLVNRQTDLDNASKYRWDENIDSQENFDAISNMPISPEVEERTRKYVVDRLTKAAATKNIEFSFTPKVLLDRLNSSTEAEWREDIGLPRGGVSWRAGNVEGIIRAVKTALKEKLPDSSIGEHQSVNSFTGYSNIVVPIMAADASIPADEIINRALELFVEDRIKAILDNSSEVALQDFNERVKNLKDLVHGNADTRKVNRYIHGDLFQIQVTEDVNEPLANAWRNDRHWTSDGNPRTLQEIQGKHAEHNLQHFSEYVDERGRELWDENIEETQEQWEQEGYSPAGDSWPDQIYEQVAEEWNDTSSSPFVWEAEIPLFWEKLGDGTYAVEEYGLATVVRYKYGENVNVTFVNRNGDEVSEIIEDYGYDNYVNDGWDFEKYGYSYLHAAALQYAQSRYVMLEADGDLTNETESDYAEFPLTLFERPTFEVSVDASGQRIANPKPSLRDQYLEIVEEKRAAAAALPGTDTNLPQVLELLLEDAAKNNTAEVRAGSFQSEEDLRNNKPFAGLQRAFNSEIQYWKNRSSGTGSNMVALQEPIEKNDQWKTVGVLQTISQAVARGVPRIMLLYGDAQPWRGAYGGSLSSTPAIYYRLQQIDWVLEDVTLRGEERKIITVTTPDTGDEGGLYHPYRIDITDNVHENLSVALGQDVAFEIQRQLDVGYIRQQEGIRYFVSSGATGNAFVHDSFGNIVHSAESVEAAEQHRDSLLEEEVIPTMEVGRGSIRSSDIGGPILVHKTYYAGSPPYRVRSEAYQHTVARVTTEAGRRQYDLVYPSIYRKHLAQFGVEMEEGLMKVPVSDMELTLSGGQRRRFHIPTELAEQFPNASIDEVFGENHGFVLNSDRGPILPHVYATRGEAEQRFEEWMSQNSTDAEGVVSVMQFTLNDAVKAHHSRPVNPYIRYARQAEQDPWLSKALEKIGKPKQTLPEKFNEIKTNVMDMDSHIYNTLNRMHGVRVALEDAEMPMDAYWQMRLANNIEPTILAAMRYGGLYFDEAGQVRLREDVGGFIENFRHAPSDIDSVMHYMLGMRAKMYLLEGWNTLPYMNRAGVVDVEEAGYKQGLWGALIAELRAQQKDLEKQLAQLPDDINVKTGFSPSTGVTYDQPDIVERIKKEIERIDAHLATKKSKDKNIAIFGGRYTTSRRQVNPRMEKDYRVFTIENEDGTEITGKFITPGTESATAAEDKYVIELPDQVREIDKESFRQALQQGLEIDSSMSALQISEKIDKKVGKSWSAKVEKYLQVNFPKAKQINVRAPKASEVMDHVAWDAIVKWDQMRDNPPPSYNEMTEEEKWAFDDMRPHMHANAQGHSREAGAEVGVIKSLMFDPRGAISWSWSRKGGPGTGKQAMAIRALRGQFPHLTQGEAEKIVTTAVEANLWTILGPMTPTWERVIDAGRERNFRPAEIDAMIQVGWDRPNIMKIADNLNNWNKALLDFGEQGGVVNPQTRPFWEHANFVPMYRVRDDRIAGPYGKNIGIVDLKKPVQRLKGGTQNVNDPIMNMFINAVQMIDSAVKNHAALNIVDSLLESGLVKKIPWDYSEVFIDVKELTKKLRSVGIDIDSLNDDALRGFQQQFAISAPQGEGVFSVLRNGRREYYKTDSPLLFASLTNINQKPLGQIFSLMSGLKRFFTGSVTLEPGFPLSNFIRDSTSAFVISRDRFSPAIDSLRGAGQGLMRIKTARGVTRALGGGRWVEGTDKKLKAMMAAGAVFESGWIGTHDAAQIRRRVQREMRDLGLVDQNFFETVLDSPRKWFNAYKDLLSAAENANRIAVYDAAIKAGKSELQAMYESLDVMDFSMVGGNNAIRHLMATVPFMNAHAQALYRGARRVKEDPSSVFMRGTLLMLAGLALYFKYREDERYNELEDWDKDTYFHWWIGDKHYRLPKGFEIGMLFNTIPERMIEYFYSNETDDGKFLIRRLAFIFGEVFSMNPVPQAFMPMAEMYFNYDFFRGRSIETYWEERRLPPDRYKYWTSPTMQEIARALPKEMDTASGKIRSPQQLQHLWEGYTGPLGSYLLYASDWLVRKMNPEKYGEVPEKMPEDWPLVGRIYRGERPRRTRYEEEFYRTFKTMMQAMESMSFNERMQTDYGDKRFEEIEQRYLPYVERARDYERYSREISDLNREMREIHSDLEMSGREKRRLLDELQREKNIVFKEAYDDRPQSTPLAASEPITGSRLQWMIQNVNASTKATLEAAAPETASLVDSVSNLSEQNLKRLRRSANYQERE